MAGSAGSGPVVLSEFARHHGSAMESQRALKRCCWVGSGGRCGRQGRGGGGGMRRFDPGKAAEILDLIAEQGLGLKGACDRVGIPRRSVREWATVVPDFGQALQLARREGYEHWS